MSRDLKVSVLVSLVDRLTRPLRGIQAQLQKIGDLGRRIGYVGAAISAISFASPLKAAADFDQELRDMAVTVGRTGTEVDAFIAKNAAAYQKLALETFQSSAEIAKGAKILFAAGLNESVIEKLVPTITRVAKAASAAIDDTAKTVFALNDTLKIKPEQMELALAKLVTAGKLGRFEFKSMASEFPELTAQVAKLGVTGLVAVEHMAAALQIAMKGTDSPTIAANNYKNFLSKIASPETKKNFKDMGVDIVGVMQSAAAQGLNPIEAVIQKIQKLTGISKKEVDAIVAKEKGAGKTDKEALEAVRTRIEKIGGAAKLSELFGDMQVLDFLLPFLANLDKYEQFKRDLKGTTTKVIDDDFQSQVAGLTSQLKRMSELGAQAARRIGLAFATNLPMINRLIEQLLGGVAALDARWPGLVDATLGWGGAILLTGAGIAILTPIVGALTAAIGVLASGLLFLVANPLGMAITALAALTAAGIYLYRNWETAWPALQEAVSTAVQAIVAATLRLSTAIAEMIASIVGWFGELPARIANALASLGGALVKVGSDAIQGLWDGMKSKFDELLGWLQDRVEALKKLLGFAGAPAINLPAVPGGGTPPSPTTDPLGSMNGFSPTSASGGVGGSNGFARTAANGNTPISGRIVVSAAEGSRIVNVQSDNPDVPLVPDRGAVLGRA